MRAVEDRDHREIEHRAFLLGEALAAPAGTPAVLADELLKRPVEVVGRLYRVLDIVLAEHLGADAQSGLVCFLVHGNVLLVSFSGVSDERLSGSGVACALPRAG